MTATASKAEVKAVLGMALAMGDAIRELGEVPSGHLYARVMDKMSLTDYNCVIGLLKESGAVTETGNLLKWVGPTAVAS